MTKLLYMGHVAFFHEISAQPVQWTPKQLWKL